MKDKAIIEKLKEYIYILENGLLRHDLDNPSFVKARAELASLEAGEEKDYCGNCANYYNNFICNKCDDSYCMYQPKDGVKDSQKAEEILEKELNNIGFSFAEQLRPNGITRKTKKAIIRAMKEYAAQAAMEMPSEEGIKKAAKDSFDFDNLRARAAFIKGAKYVINYLNKQ